MLTQLAVAALGAGIYLRIVAKEKNRRRRHLLLRLAAQVKRLAEQEAAAEAAAAGNDAPETAGPGPVVAEAA